MPHVSIEGSLTDKRVHTTWMLSTSLVRVVVGVALHLVFIDVVWNLPWCSLARETLVPILLTIMWLLLVVHVKPLALILPTVSQNRVKDFFFATSLPWCRFERLQIILTEEIERDGDTSLLFKLRLLLLIEVLLGKLLYFLNLFSVILSYRLIEIALNHLRFGLLVQIGHLITVSDAFFDVLFLNTMILRKL